MLQDIAKSDRKVELAKSWSTIILLLVVTTSDSGLGNYTMEGKIHYQMTTESDLITLLNRYSTFPQI
jgi:hypothetical protein